jgi:hypothetical protein
VPLIALAVLASTTPASAGEWGKIGSGGGAIAGGRNFGLGGYVGTELGIGMKWFFNKPHALDIGIGFGSWWGSWFRLHIDYLYHFLVHRGRHAEVLLYPGIGGGIAYLRDRDWYYGDVCGPYANCFGGFIRVPFGVNWLIQAHHFDIFAEIALDVQFTAHGSYVWAWFEALGGLRYYF